jgi:hypothetical protein
LETYLVKPCGEAHEEPEEARSHCVISILLTTIVVFVERRKRAELRSSSNNGGGRQARLNRIGGGVPWQSQSPRPRSQDISAVSLIVLSPAR